MLNAAVALLGFIFLILLVIAKLLWHSADALLAMAKRFEELDRRLFLELAAIRKASGK
jgi:hypothetical protein